MRDLGPEQKEKEQKEPQRRKPEQGGGDAQSRWERERGEILAVC